MWVASIGVICDPMDIESIFETLNDAGVRYVCVGGVAVVLRGVDRITADLDLVLDLQQANALAAIEALIGAGFKAKIPADPRGFADPEIRASWINEKGMRVMSFFDPSANRPDVDLFVENPIEFSILEADATTFALRRTHCRVASVAHLVQMKQAAGRPKDLSDIRELHERQALQSRRES
jgi:hypothetical protein